MVADILVLYAFDIKSKTHNVTLRSIIYISCGIFCNGNCHILGPPLTQKLIFSANEPQNLSSSTRYKRRGIYKTSREVHIHL